MNYWQNYAEGIRWPCYIENDIWFQGDFWEASSHSFQSSFSKAWHLIKSCQVFHDGLHLGRCFLGFVLSVLQYYSAVWSSSADTHLKLLDRVVSGASFWTGGVFEFDLTHRRSAAVLWMLYKNRCNPMHPLYLYLSRMCRFVLHAVLLSHIGTLMHLLTAESRSTERLLFPYQFLCLTILVTPYSIVCDWRLSRTGPMSLYWPRCSLHILSPTVFSFSSLILWVGIVGLGYSNW